MTLVLPSMLRAALAVVFVCLPFLARAESVLLDGSNDHVAIGHDAALATQQFTIETWFKREAGGLPGQISGTGYYPLISRGNPTNYFLGVNTSGRLYGQVTTESIARVSVLAPDPVPLGEWHHGALTYDGANLRLYLDGVQVAETPLTGALYTGTPGTRLGQIIQGSTASGAWKGAIDETRIWNRARSAAEVAQNYVAEIRFAPGLLARWGFNGTANLTTVSEGANEIPATLANGAANSADAPPLTATAPSASISTPATPISVVAGTPIQVAGSATAGGTPIAKVEFFANHTKVGEDDTAPYVCEWVPQTTGLFILRAVAVGTDGLRNGSAAGTTIGVMPALGSDAVYFDGENAYADAGTAAQLSLGRFTLETRFLMDGDGKPVGVAGFAAGVCLIARSTHTDDTNYFLGISRNGNVLMAGFESGTSTITTGRTAITRGVWHHAAATFDGEVMRLYLDGVLDGEKRFDSPALVGATKRTVIGGLAIANPTPGPAYSGLFQGLLDEVRIWDYPRSSGDIAGSQSSNVPTAPGLVSRWSMDAVGGGTLVATGSAPADATLVQRFLPAKGAPLQTGTAPTVVLTAPSAEISINRDSPLLLEASLSGAGDPIARVEFWSHSGKLGEDTTAPYSFNWTAAPMGFHWVNAVAITTTGATSSSQSVRVTIVPPTGAGSLYFNGASGSAGASSLTFTGNKFTLEGWFRREGLAIAGVYPSGTTGELLFQLGFSSGASATVGIRTADSKVFVETHRASNQDDFIETNAQIGFGTWTHSALTFDGDKLRVYIDGVLRGEIALIESLGTLSPLSVSIGGRFKGNVDEMRFWDHDRSASEISGTRFQQFTNATGLVSRWSFSESSGSTAFATGIGAKNFNLQNSPVWTTGLAAGPGSAPSISITSPLNQTIIPVPTPVTVFANASDSDGTVAKVEFFLESTKIGEDSSAPYQCTFTAQEIGTKYLRAVAIDNSGTSSTHRIALEIFPPAGTQGLYFDGAGDSVRIQSDAAIGVGHFTIEAWIRRDGAGIASSTIPGVVPIVGRGYDTPGINYLLGLEAATGKLVAQVRDFAQSQISASVIGATALPLGEWHHVAVTCDGASLRLYVDGIADGAADAFLAPRSRADFLTLLGGWPSASNQVTGSFHGYLDEVRIWNHARGGAAIAADRWRTTFSDPELLARWAMNEGSGTQIFNANATIPATGTITGARWTIGRPTPAAPVPTTTVSAAAIPRSGESGTLTATPAVPAEVARIEFYANGVKIGETTSAPWSIPFTPSAPGRYVITVNTTTTAGGVGASNDLIWEVQPPAGSGGIYLDGDNDYVEFPSRAELTLPSFTVETWFRCEGPGKANFYTTAGTISPILGMGSTWFVGLRPSDRGLVLGTQGGSPIVSATPIEYGRWYHLAITAAPNSFQLFVDGVLSATAAPTSFVFQSVHPLAVGTSLMQDGVATGAFHGSVDEIRIWSKVRSTIEIAADRSKEIHSAPDLVARWSGTDGLVVRDSGPSALDGTLRNGAMAAAGVDLLTNAPPTIALQSPAAGSTITPPASLTAVAQGELGEALSAEFRGREIDRDANDFTVVVLPSLFGYTTSTSGGVTTLQTMFDWIVANRASRNIAFVVHTGGLAPTFNTTAWNAASQAFARLENPATTGLPLGIPYAVTRSSDSDFTANFGPSRFANKPWYGENYGSFGYFSHFRAGGVDMGIIFAPDSSIELLRKHAQAYPRRQFIAVNPHTFAATPLADYSNVALSVSSGQLAGESRSIVSSATHAYHSMYADFPTTPNGGDGWLRLLTFSPLRGEIRVQTFSPSKNQFETDQNSDFSIPWKSPLATLQGVVASGIASESGQPITTNWIDPQHGRRYEWQATVSDSTNTVASARRDFVTPPPVAGQAPAIVLDRPLGGTTATLPCVIPMIANVTPGVDPIERVEFIVNGHTLYSVASAPYFFTWAPGANGTYQVKAAAIDRSGRRTETASVQVSVAASTGKTIFPSITSPVSGSALYDSSTVPITTTTGGTATVAYVDFFVDGALIGRDSTSPFSVLWDYSGVGPRDIQALAVATSGESATSLFTRVNLTELNVPNVTRQPYLQMATPTEVTVCWRTSQTHPARLRFGTSPNALNTQLDETTPTTNHSMRLTGLQPNTRYYYGVGSRKAFGSGGDATTYFTTPPIVGRARNTRIWALGDFGLANAGQASTRDAYYAFTGNRDTDLMLMLGDNAYTSGTDTDYQNGVFNIYPSVLRRAFTWPALGNHDTGGSTTYNPAIAYYSIFQLPTAAECGGAPSGTERYYSFDYANIHFVCLDSMTTDRSATGAMAIWLRADLAATQARWIIAFWHHPPYSKGGWDSDSNTDQIQMRTNFVPILEEYGVDLVLGGHSHNYERSWFMAGHYGTSSTFNQSMKKSTTWGDVGPMGPTLNCPGPRPSKTARSTSSRAMPRRSIRPRWLR